MFVVYINVKKFLKNVKFIIYIYACVYNYALKKIASYRDNVSNINLWKLFAITDMYCENIERKKYFGRLSGMVLDGLSLNNF